MTIKEAIVARIQPYTLPDDTIELLALDCDIDDIEDDYNSSLKTAVTRVVIAALGQLTTLTREQDHGSTQTYDPELLQKRIIALRNEIDEADFSRPKNEDITEYW